MRSSLFSQKNRQRTFFWLFFLIFTISLVGLFRIFYTTTSEAEAATGGEITEAAVGVLTESYNFNPLFATGVEADVASVLFLSLMRYNPETGNIEDYIATHDLSADKRTYTFYLQEGILWHDGEEMTADDIYFTYNDVIQNENFPATLLRETFKDVEIKKIDDYTVSFTIPEKRKTFFTNFTLGILPQHALIGTPIEDILYAPFNQSPVGSGPYRFEEFFQEPARTAVRLSAFPDFFDGQPKIDALTLYVYPTVEQLIPHVSEFDAIRPLQTRVANILPGRSHFEELKSITPRYVAVFFNLKDDALTTKEVRQAMRAAVDTNALAEKYAGERVDTPLVEMWPENDIVNISPQRAQELLVESGYLFDYERNLPEEEEEETEEGENEESVSDESTPDESTEEASNDEENTEETSEEEVLETEEEQPEEESPVEEVQNEEEDTTRVETPEETPVGEEIPVAEENTPEPEESIAEEIVPEQEISDSEIGAQSSRYIYEPSREKKYATTTSDFYIVGAFPEGTTAVAINGYKLRLFDPVNERFTYHASTELKTLSHGENTYLITFYNANGGIIDTEEIMITLSASLGMRLLPQAHAEEADDSETIKYRTNEEGEHISLSLSYLENFEYLSDLAEDLQTEWEQIGIEIRLIPLSPDAMRNAITNREYEMLLLPQYLGYNLDPYAYFDLSQAKEGGFNVANWKNLKASLLLKEIRATHDPAERLDSLSQLRDIIIDDVPAIFLFTPYYSWLYDAKVKNVHGEHMVDAKDRYSRINEFYIRQARTYAEGNILSGFTKWLVTSMRETFSL